jgi:hypothetical protein
MLPDVNHRFILFRSYSPQYHSATLYLSLVRLSPMPIQGSVPLSPLHSLVPEQVWTFLHSENKQTEQSCYYLYGEQETGIEKRPKVVALFGPRIRQKYHYVIKASLQNVPHSVSANSCRVSRTLKPMWSAPVEEPMGFKYEFINAGV